MLTLLSGAFQLRENSTIIKSFVKDIGQAYQPNEGEHPVNYDDKYWSLGDLGRLKAETKKIAPSVRELVEKAQQQKRQAAELQSLMLKGELFSSCSLDTVSRFGLTITRTFIKPRRSARKPLASFARGRIRLSPTWFA